MDIESTISQFLPKYLSPNDQKDLLKCIKDFPDNINKRFYTRALKDQPIIYQGDGIKKLPIINLPDSKIKNAMCIITSNTCDVEFSNKRFYPIRLTYCPIIELGKYRNFLKSQKLTPQQIKQHITAIKKQEITQIFYLPAQGKMKQSIVFLDRINNCDNSILNRRKLKAGRVFTLSNYGFYLFLLKLSMSFTRIGEGVNRS